MIDNRHKIIGGVHRARSRYYMLMWRIKNSHLRKNKCYSNVSLDVSKDDFIKWFTERDFEGCSVDRIDVNGNYTLSNMQLIPLGINISKDKVKLKDGKCECFKCRLVKPITEFVKEARRLNGYSTICKDCERVRKKNNANKK